MITIHRGQTRVNLTCARRKSMAEAKSAVRRLGNKGLDRALDAQEKRKPGFDRETGLPGVRPR
jgi:hypothetical protein